MPSASSYHGAFAHVHNEGAAYFAHGGNWEKLLNYNTGTDNISVGGTINAGGDVQVTGIVTATRFFGDGSQLTGVGGGSGGLQIYDEYNLIGTASSLNFVWWKCSINI